MDVVNVRCTECGGRIGLNRDDLGHRVRCPLCQKIIFAAVAAEPPLFPTASEMVEDSVPQSPPASPASPHADPEAEDHLSAFELAGPAAPGEGESIFSSGEDASDDLFGEPKKPLIDMAALDAPEDGAAEAVFRTGDAGPFAASSASTHATDDFPGAATASGSGSGLLQDHPLEGTQTAGEHHVTTDAGQSGQIPRPALTAPARPRSAPSHLVPILLIALVPYSILTTAMLVYVLFQQRNLNKDPTIHYLEKMLEENIKNPNQKKIKRIQHDLSLPDHLRTPLGTPLRIGAVEVKPLKVAYTDKGDLALFLRLKNISGQNGGGRLLFNPLPTEFADFDRKNPDDRPYQYLDAGKTRLYGGKLQWLKGKIGNESPAVDNELGPDQEMTVMIITLPEDRAAVPLVLEATESLVWRVQLRRGLETLHGKEWPVTCVVGIEFRSEDIIGRK